MVRLEAEAKNSSLWDRMREPKGAEMRSMLEAKVGVIWEGAMGEREVWVSWIVSGESAWVSMIRYSWERAGGKLNGRI